MPIWSGGGGGGGLPSGWTQTGSPGVVHTNGGDISTLGGLGAGEITTADGTLGGTPQDSFGLAGFAGDATAATSAIQGYAGAGGTLRFDVRGDGRAAVLDASGNPLVQVAGDGSIDINGTTGKLTRLSDSIGNTYITIQDNVMTLGKGFALRTGVQTQVVLSGALPTVAPVSATAFQVNANYDTILVVPVTYNPGVATTATCKVELSPDNVTFSTLVTKTVPVGTVFDGQIDPLTIRVPGGWYVKLTVTNATLGTGTYYY